MQRCVECGRELPPTCASWRKWCDECMEERRKYLATMRRKRKKECTKPRTDSDAAAAKPKTLAEVQRDAAALGLSYGQYMARMHGG